MSLKGRIEHLEEEDMMGRTAKALAQLTDAELDALEAITSQGGEARNEEQQAAWNRYTELWNLESGV